MCLSLCQSAIKGILRNMSMLNVRFSGLLPRVEFIAAFMACIAMDKASLMYSLVLAKPWGFFALVHTSLMWHFWESFSILKYVKEASKQTKNKQWLWLVFLVWNLGLGSWIGTLNALNLCGFPQTWIFYGPIRSTVHSSNMIHWTSRSGKNPYPLSYNLALW